MDVIPAKLVAAGFKQGAGIQQIQSFNECHAELVSASHDPELDSEPKQVRNDNNRLNKSGFPPYGS